MLYRQAVRTALENQPNLMIFQQAVEDLIVENDRVVGAVTQMGLKFRAKAVVLTVGTFLDGKIHIGLDNYSGGRAGDPPSIPLSRRLRELPLRVSRLKTGTPPRIDARTINFSVLAQQHGDNPMPVFSFMGNTAQHPQQVPCYITHTNEKTHDVIRNNLDRSPMYAGVIEGSVRVIAHRSKTKSCALPTGTSTKSSRAGRINLKRNLPERDLHQPAF